MRALIGWTSIALIVLALGATAASAWASREPYAEKVQRLGRQRQFFNYYHEPAGEPAAVVERKGREAIAAHLRSADALLRRLAILDGLKAKGALDPDARERALAEVVACQKRLRAHPMMPRIPGSLLKRMDTRELMDDKVLIGRLQSLSVFEKTLESLDEAPELSLQSLEFGGRSDRNANGILVIAAARDIGLKLKVRGPRQALLAWLRNLSAEAGADETRTPFYLRSIKLGFLPGSAETIAELSIFALVIELEEAESISFAPAETEREKSGEED